MEKIDIENWDRSSHYKWFSQFADPTLALDVRIDDTILLSFCNKEKISSFGTILYTVCYCINKIPALRLRMLNGSVVRVENANCAYTVLNDKSQFMNAHIDTSLSFKDFLRKTEENKHSFVEKHYVQKEYNSIEIIDDIYCSCAPWIDFLSVKQPIPDFSAESLSIPRVCWGKYVFDSDKAFITMNITVNHALVDGLDLALVFGNIQKTFNNIDEFINLHQ